MKLNNATEKNNLRGGNKMRIEKIVVFLALFAVLATAVFAATVTHPAENIRAGIFGNAYAGNWGFMNGSVGIGTTNPQWTLDVHKSIANDDIARFANTNDTNGYGVTIITAANDATRYSFQARGNTTRQDFTVLSNGNVGIGTISPTSRLHINGTGALLNVSNSTHSFLFVSESLGNVGIGTASPNTLLEARKDQAFSGAVGGANDTIMRIRNDNNTGSAYLQMIAGSGADVGAGLRLVHNSSTQGDAYLQVLLGASNNERMRIDKDGNVGIGTTSPGYKLDVNGSIRTLAANQSGNISNAPSAFGIVVPAADTPNPGAYRHILGTTEGSTVNMGIFAVDDGAGGAQGLAIATGNNTVINESMRISSTGKVGIGTASPDYNMHLETSSGNAVFNVQSTAGGDPIIVMKDGTDASNSAWSIQGGGTWLFRYGANVGAGALPVTTIMSMTTDGNVGIGTTGPSSTLHLNASLPYIVIQDSDSSGNAQVGFISFRNSSNTETGYMGFGSTSNDDITIQNNYEGGHIILNTTGNVGIGTKTPAAKLQIYNATGTLLRLQGTSTNDDCTQGADPDCSGLDDFAELIPSSEELEAGDVVVIDSESSKYTELIRKSAKQYDTKVAGIVSTKPAIVIEGDAVVGMGSQYNFDPNKPPIAMAGRVAVKATAENGAIKKGDLLTTSSIPGHAMKCNDKLKCIGAIVGKALEPLDSGTGKVMALVTLQ